MMKRKMLLPALAIAAAFASAAAFALPTTGDVEAAVRAGNYPQAETLMQQVVAAKPQSPKAHYIYAEILAHEARFSDAAAQARQARELDPKIGFTDPDKFRNFESELQREQAPPAAQPQARAIQQQAPAYREPASSGIPGWVWFGGVALVLFFIFRAVSRRAMGGAQQAGFNGNVNQGGGYGVQPGYGQPGYGQQGYGQPGFGQAPGGGLLRTGLAAAGGVAAGMLVEKMIDGRHDEDRSGLMGGGTGFFDNGSSQAATELENRPIDFGNGGNDWGGDAGGGGGGGGGDFTPSGDDGGGW